MSPGELLFQIVREAGQISAARLADQMVRRYRKTTRDAALDLIQYHARRGNLVKVGTARGRYRGKPCNVYRLQAGATVQVRAVPREAPPVVPRRRSAAAFSIVRAWGGAR